ncbi:AAA family ATPase [Siccirubricoccus phaeus]|uniref:AAA family ATPase n=1 Tax=Siccirubricoccus phaeus TaxID=2595053 RepID=UPI00165C9A55|nr:AAA family ATPase [Siccirubricoccus phaeus]
MSTGGAFSRWAARGFGPALLPIIPPNVALTVSSKVPPSQRGKVPGLRTGRGEWHGYIGRHGKQATSADHATWDAMGAGVGIQCGRWIAVDIDVLDERTAALLAALAVEMLGSGAVRIGRAPKRVLLYAAASGEAIAKRRFAFRLPGDDTPHAVEILGEGQFFVCEGVHPGTGRPYAWPEGQPLAFDLVEVTAEQIDAYLAAVAVAVGELGGEVVQRATAAVGTGRHEVDQAGLRAPSAELLLEAAPHVPNTGGYDDWIAGIAAWKGAATGLLEDDGETLAREWTERWTGEGAGGGGHIDFDDKWARVLPPFAAGWPQLERMARAAGWYGGVQAEFAPIVAQMREQAEAAARTGRFGRLQLRTAADAADAPPRRYIVKPLLGEGELSVWWGAPKTGKSFLALRIAWCIALGRDDLWDFRVKRPRRVLYVAAEGESGFRGRIGALTRELGSPGDRLRYLAQPVTIGPPGEDLQDLTTAALAMGAELIVVDTLARTFGAGDENTAQDMGRFVANLDRLRAETGAHVLVIHHGRKDGGDLRGSGALAGAADLVVKVEKGTTRAEPSTATIEAAKDDADGRALAFRLRSIDRSGGGRRRQRDLDLHRGTFGGASVRDNEGSEDCRGGAGRSR